MKYLFITLFSLATFLSCNSSGKSEPYKQKSVGNINSLQVVIEDDLWNGPVGETIRNHYASPTDGLPQEEPLFSMRQMNPSDFTGFAQSNRLFLHVSLGEDEKTSIANNSFAKPQTGAIIISKTEEGLIASLNKSYSQVIDSLQERLGVQLKVPSAYRIAKQSDDFYWIRKDLKSGSTNIIVYEVPLNTITNDSLAMGEIIAMRDNLSGDYMPVEEGGRFITEEAYAPFLFKSEIDGKFAYEMKGTWEVKTQYMAGPFLNYAIKDEANNRYLILEGFTYAPSVEKRNLQFELESILKSAKIN